jgi:hypothetical protein
MTKIDQKILLELRRYNQINSYIMEQEAPLPPPPGEDVPPTPGGDVPPPPGGDVAPPAPTEPEKVDVENDPDVEKVGGSDDEKSTDESGTEEMDITQLVDSQKNIETKQEDYFQQLFNQLSSLEEKLSGMDEIVNKINNLEGMVQKMKPKSPEERLELRSLDSGPFNQKLSDFFQDKQEDFEKTGKNEYILTQDDVESYSPLEIKKTFDDFPGGKPPLEKR